MSKKYQVFISSTYSDLIDERKAVEETIIRSGDIPVGMEAFPAADEEQFEFIKTVIDQCDYYVLVIAGRYGSIASDGLSYTEKEYHYAVEMEVPVLVMLRKNRDTLPLHKCESEAEGKEALENFIKQVSIGRLRKEWGTTDGLKLAVREALDHAKATKSRPGWVRGDQVSSSHDLQRLVSLQEENDSLKAELAEAKPPLGLPGNLAGLDESLTLEGRFREKSFRSDSYGGKISKYDRKSFEIETTFGELFSLIAPKLMMSLSEAKVDQLIAKSLYENRHGHNLNLDSFHVTGEILDDIKIQLMALGVVNVKASRSTQGNVLLFWRLTESGEQEMFKRRVTTV